MSNVTTLEAVERDPANVPATLDALKKAGGYRTDQQFADALGWSRQTANKKLRGATKLTVQDLADLAELFGVPIDLFFLAPDVALEVAKSDYGFSTDWRRGLRRRHSTWIADLAA